MKRFVLLTILISSLFLVFISETYAQTTTLYTKLALTDNCNGGGYTGDYYVTVDIYYDGVYQCTAVGTTRSGAMHCVTLISNCDVSGEEPYYQEKLISVVRADNSCSYTTPYLNPNQVSWSAISSCGSSTPQFTVSM